MAALKFRVRAQTFNWLRQLAMTPAEQLQQCNQIPNVLVPAAVNKPAVMCSNLALYLSHARLGLASSFNMIGGHLQWLL